MFYFHNITFQLLGEKIDAIANWTDADSLKFTAMWAFPLLSVFVSWFAPDFRGLEGVEEKAIWGIS